MLAALTFAHLMPPALLLLLVFLLGTGAALGTPAYQSLVPELVPRDEIPAASALNSISINVARALGPAIAGVLVATAGVGTTFTVAAATALCYAVVVALWHPTSTERPRPERFVPALRAGSRYVRNAPVVRRILLRAALFLVPASSLFALLPLIASHRLGLGSGGYGLLLAALGLGAIAGALVLPRVRTRLSINTLVTLASGSYALVLAAVALLHDAVPVLLLLIPAGVAWVVVLSTLNASLQLFLPAWVRGRSLAAYTIVLFGSQALGALIFGALADLLGLVQALLIAAGSAAVAAASIRIWPFLETSGMNRSTVVYWPEPQLASDLDPDGRTITVTVSYRVPTANQQPFVEAMAQRARLTAPNRRRQLGPVPRRGARRHLRRALRRPLLGRAPPPTPRTTHRNRPRLPATRDRALRRRARRRPPRRRRRAAARRDIDRRFESLGRAPGRGHGRAFEPVRGREL